MRVVLVILGATILASFTDWVFFEALIRRHYAQAPEAWRAEGGTGRIVASEVVGTLASMAAVILYPWVGRPVLLALLLWCAGALPGAIQQSQWMRVSPAISASHAAGWLVRLLIATMLAAAMLGRG